MARPSRALQKFVELYTNGPDYLKGDWERCTVASGCKETPDPNDAMVKRMIKQAGGKPEPEPEVAVEKVAPEPEPASADDAISGLLEAKEQGIPWTELKGRLTTVIEGVAKGDVKATAAQVSMLKYILGESKEETAATARGARGVILLPVQGAGPTAKLDVQMRQQIRAAEAEQGSDK